MRGSKKCEPGCSCGRHTRSGNRDPKPRTSVIDWTDTEARKEYNRQKAREAYAADPSKFKGRTYRNHLKVTYGITPEGRQKMLDEQGGRCYLCGKTLDTALHQRNVYVDHNHACCPGKKSCGKCVRGLTCHQCNTGTGFFGDDPDLMERVAANLRAANERLKSV